MKARLDWIIDEPLRTPAASNLKLDVDEDVLMSLFKNTVVDKDYYDYIRGKSVVIIGPADYLRGQNRGSYFDSFDIIVRLNKSYPVNSQDRIDLGSRTNIRYHNACTREEQGGSLKLEFAKESQLKYISSIFPRHLSYFDNDIKLLENEIRKTDVKLHTFTDLEQYLTFHSALETRPNAGVAAIIDLINYNPAKLHISGFSFFNTPYLNTYEGRRKSIPEDYQNNKFDNHAQGPQKDLIKLFLERLDYISVDEEVKQYLV